MPSATLVPIQVNVPNWRPLLNRYYFGTLPAIPEVTHEDSTWPSQDEKAASIASLEVVDSVSDSEVDVSLSKVESQLKEGEGFLIDSKLKGSPSAS